MNSFRQENGEIVEANHRNDTQMMKVQRQFSIPNALIRANISHEKKFNKGISIDNSHLDDLKNIPKGRLVSFFTDKLQQRPIFSPFCHPVDLEGLQETAV